MDLGRWQTYYDQLVLPYVLAYAAATVGVAVGFIFPLLFRTQTVSAPALVIRWLGVVAGLFLAAGIVWWFVVEPDRERLVLGTVGLALAATVEAVGGGWLLLRSSLLTSLLALVAAALTALSLLALAASLVIVTLDRRRVGPRVLYAHWALALAVPVALVLADRALPFEPDPVIGLIFVVVPFIALLLLGNAELTRVWLDGQSRRQFRPVRGM